MNGEGNTYAPIQGGRCPFELANGVQFRALADEIGELKTRVGRLETTLARGVGLLIANLACVIATLAQQLMR